MKPRIATLTRRKPTIHLSVGCGDEPEATKQDVESAFQQAEDEVDCRTETQVDEPVPEADAPEADAPEGGSLVVNGWIKILSPDDAQFEQAYKEVLDGATTWFDRVVEKGGE